MKKCVSIILAVLFLISSTAVFASNGKGEKGKHNGTVNFEFEINNIENKLKMNHQDEDLREWFIKQLAELKNKLSSMDKNYKKQELTVYLNGTKFKLNSSNMVGYNNVYIPTDLIKEGLNASIQFNQNKRIITITKGSVKIVINLNNKKINLNGTEIKSNILSKSRPSATIQLIKYIAEALGYNVDINEKEGIIVIEGNGVIPVGNGNGLKGEYYDNPDFTNLKLTRLDQSINFNWGTGSPDSSINGDKFSVRWTGQILPLNSGEYTFYTASDDGVVLWVNGVKIINKWIDQSETENKGKVWLTAGQKVHIKLEYYENEGSSTAKLLWSSVNRSKQIIPQSQLFSNTTAAVAPTVPAGLTASPISASQVNLSWTQSSGTTGVAGYKVFRNGTQVGTVTNATNYSDTGLSASTGYLYSVSAYDAAGNNSAQCTQIYAVTFSNSTDTVAPTVPVSLTASPISVSQINLSWVHSTDAIGVAGYKVFRNGTQVGTVTNTTNYYDTGLSASTGYLYSVSAYDAAGNNSAQCTQIYAVTRSSNTDTVAPTVPTGLTATPISTSQITLSWVQSTDAFGVAGYKVFRNGTQVGTVTNATNYYDTGLSASTGYLYSVSAYDAAGNNSAQCTQIYAVTLAINGNGNGLRGEYFDNIDLTNPKLTKVDSKIEFNWGSGSPDPLLAGDTFSIRWSGQVLPLYSEEYTFNTISDDGVRLWVNGVKIIDNWTPHSPTSNDGKIRLNAGQKYDVRLEYFEDAGEAAIKLSWSSPSQQKQVIPQSQLFGVATDTQAPTVPGGLTTTAISMTQVNLKWTASTDSFGVVGYIVFRGGTQIGIVTNATTYNDSGLTPNTTYSYTLVAFDGSGNKSSQCTPLPVTTRASNNMSINDNTIGTADNQFNYSSNWSYGNQANAYLNDNHWSSTTGAYYQIQFTGTQIKLYGSLNTSHGVATISIDDKVVAIVDFYSAARSDNVLVYTSQLLQRGSHKLKVIVSGAKNTNSSNCTIPADRVDVIDG